MRARIECVWLRHKFPGISAERSCHVMNILAKITQAWTKHYPTFALKTFRGFPRTSLTLLPKPVYGGGRQPLSLSRETASGPSLSLAISTMWAWARMRSWWKVITLIGSFINKGVILASALKEANGGRKEGQGKGQMLSHPTRFFRTLLSPAILPLFCGRDSLRNEMCSRMLFLLLSPFFGLAYNEFHLGKSTRFTWLGTFEELRCWRW